MSLLLLVLTLVSLSVVLAPRPAGAGLQIVGKVFALLVGIDTYGDASLPRLRSAVSDARAVRDRLLPLIPGTPGKVTLLENAQATRRGILIAFDALGEAGPDDTVLVYFASHGTGEQLVPYDAETGHVDATTLALADVLRRVNALKAGRVFVILDTRAGSPAPYAAVPLRPGRFVLAATLSLEDEKLGQGLLTHFFLKGAEGAAADPTGAVDVLALARYVAGQITTAGTAGAEGEKVVFAAGLLEGPAPVVARPPAGPRR